MRGIDSRRLRRTIRAAAVREQLNKTLAELVKPMAAGSRFHVCRLGGYQMQDIVLQSGLTTLSCNVSGQP